jgi:hypothetical protein
MQSHRQSNANWLRGTQFLANFEESFQQGQITDPGPISYRGPGPRNFLYGAPDVNAENRAFENTRIYRQTTTFIKVYPICGTEGYFSLQSSTNDKAYLIAVGAESEIVARVVEINNLVDITDRACWQELKGCPDPNFRMLENKLFPGLTLTLDNNKIIIASSQGTNGQSCWEITRPATIDMPMPPSSRPRTRDDYDIRDGENLYDNNRSWGPESVRSYELHPTWTRTWEECLDHAIKQPLGNGFVFIKPGHSHGNCRTKVGGYWKQNRNWYEISADRGVVSGMLN